MGDNSYPEHLVPHSEYLDLSCEPFVESGCIVRCLDKPAQLEGGRISDDSFQFPQRSHWLNHFSVNLLGNFKLHDCAWWDSIDKDSLRREAFYKLWTEGADGLLPTDQEAKYPGEGKWGYFWVPISKIHNQTFSSGSDVYKCRVVHRPTMINYWHFELHFFNADNQDLGQLVKDKKLTKGTINGIVAGIKAKLIMVCRVDEAVFADWQDEMYKKQVEILIHEQQETAQPSLSEMIRKLLGFFSTKNQQT